VQASLADVVRAPQLVMQVLTNGGPALASSFLLDDDANIDELLEWVAGLGGTAAEQRRIAMRRAACNADLHTPASAELLVTC
jgi:hypothetical protein